MKKIDLKITLLLIVLIYLIPLISYGYYGNYGTSYGTYGGNSYGSSNYQRNNLEQQNRTRQDSLDRARRNDLSTRNNNIIKDNITQLNKIHQRATEMESINSKNLKNLNKINGTSSGSYSSLEQSKKQYLEGKVNVFCSVTGSVKKCQNYCAKLNKIDKGNKLCQGNPTAKITNLGKI